MAISPAVACLTMLVASSVATIDTRPAAWSSKPSVLATAAAWRRTSPTSLDWDRGISTLLPTGDRHGRAFARRRADREIVAQPLGAAQPEPETAAGRIALFHRLLDIGDPGALVGEGQPQPLAAAILHPVQGHGAAAAILPRVARELTGGGHDLGQVDQAEAALRRPVAHHLPDPDHVFAAADIH